MPMHECREPGCRQLTTGKYCAKHTKGDNQVKRWDRRRNENDPFRRLYGLTRWILLRKEVLIDEPICRRCKLAAACIADHIIPARVYAASDPELFYDRSNLQPLCDPCHHSKTSEDKHEYGLQSYIG
jgi:5-methylcytosine-specific restriction protein A